MKKLLIFLISTIMLQNSVFAIQFSEISFKDKDADWIEIDIHSTSNIIIKIDSIVAEIEKDELKDINILMIHFKAEKEEKIKDSNILHVYTTNKGLTATTEQITIENNIIIDYVCWQNSTPTEKELKDLSNIEKNIEEKPKCFDSESVKKNQSIAKINNQWKLLKHPTPANNNKFTNNAPIAIITIQKGKTEDFVPFSINLDGSNSYDPDNDNLNYLWQFPNKTFDTKNPPSYKFNKTGEYEISLKVTDEFGEYDTEKISINSLKKPNKEFEKLIKHLNIKNQNNFTQQGKKRSWEIILLIPSFLMCILLLLITKS